MIEVDEYILLNSLKFMKMGLMSRVWDLVKKGFSFEKMGLKSKVWDMTKKGLETTNKSLQVWALSLYNYLLWWVQGKFGVGGFGDLGYGLGIWGQIFH